MSLRAKEEVIFLIDEPELHLHPQLRTSLAKHLRASECQAILSTHSPSFVDLGAPLSIARFDPAGDAFPKGDVLDSAFHEGTIRTNLDEIAKYYRDKTVYREDDAQLLFARRVLLVQGPAEKYGIPIIAKLANAELPDLTIIPCHGKTKIPDYALLCRAYGLRYCCIFDLDGTPTTDTENARVLASFGPDDIFTYASSFEDLLGVGQGKHKGSRVLSRIEAFEVWSAVPEEIQQAIGWLVTWLES